STRPPWARTTCSRQRGTRRVRWPTSTSGPAWRAASSPADGCGAGPRARPVRWGTCPSTPRERRARAGSAGARGRWPRAPPAPAPPPPVALFAAAAQGDPAARAVRERVLAGVAAAVRLVALTFDPERVVLGGGLTALGRPLLSGVREALTELARGSPFLASLD